MLERALSNLVYGRRPLVEKGAAAVDYASVSAFGDPGNGSKRSMTVPEPYGKFGIVKNSNAFCSSSVVQGVVRIKAGTLFSAEFKIWRVRGLKKELVRSGTLYDMFHDSFYGSTVTELLTQWYVWHQVAGVSYLLADTDENGAIGAYVPKPKDVAIVTGKQRRILGVAYSSGGETSAYAYWQVAMISDYRIRDHLYPIARGEAADWSRLATDAIKQQQYWYYQRGGMPAVSISLMAERNPIGARDFIEQVVRRRTPSTPRIYYGVANRSRVEPFMSPQTDAFGKDMLVHAARDVCSLYGVPYDLYAGTGSDASVKLEAHLWGHGLIAEAKSISECLTAFVNRINKLANPVSRVTYLVELDWSKLPFAATAALEWAKVRTVYVNSGVMSPNEVRDALGLEAWPDEYAEFADAPFPVSAASAAADAAAPAAVDPTDNGTDPNEEGDRDKPNEPGVPDASGRKELSLVDADSFRAALGE